MVGQVGSASACYGSSLGSNPDISQKYKMGEITVVGKSIMQIDNRWIDAIE